MESLYPNLLQSQEQVTILMFASLRQVIAGSAYTGPSMNPAHAFSWNYFLDVRVPLV